MRRIEKTKSARGASIMVNDFLVFWLTENQPYETVESCSRYYPLYPLMTNQ